MVHPLQSRTRGVEDDQRFEARLHLGVSSSRSGEFEFSRLEVVRVRGVGVGRWIIAPEQRTPGASVSRERPGSPGPDVAGLRAGRPPGGASAGSGAGGRGAEAARREAGRRGVTRIGPPAAATEGR